MKKAIGKRLDVIVKSAKEITLADYAQMVLNIEALRPLVLNCPSEFKSNSV